MHFTPILYMTSNKSRLELFSNLLQLSAPTVAHPQFSARPYQTILGLSPPYHGDDLTQATSRVGAFDYSNGSVVIVIELDIQPHVFRQVRHRCDSRPRRRHGLD